MSNNGFIIEDDYSHSGGGRKNNSPSGKKGKKKIKRSTRIWVNTILSIILVISIVGTGLCYLLGFQDMSDDNGLKGMEDVRTSINEDVSYFLVAGTDEDKVLTDIIMVVCYDHGHQKANILQIPRDTFIGTDIPTCKVNAVYSTADESKGESGINILMKRVNDYFGLPIDQYVTVSIEAFRKIVDAMGGIDVYVPESMTAYDSRAACYNIEAGMQHLEGGQAEAFIRYRRGYNKGDIGRVEAQRNFYAAFFKAVLNMSNSQMISVAKNCYSDVATSMSIGTLLSYAEEAKKMKISDIGIYAVPGQAGMYAPTGENLSYYSIHKSEYVDLVNQYMFPYNKEGINAENILIEEIHTSDELEENFVDTGGNLNNYTGDPVQSTPASGQTGQ